jgi:hypothetical protein
MTKRIALLAGMALIAVLSAAPDAMANHCFRCRFYFTEGEWDCFPLPGPVLGGKPFCAEGGTWCETWGDPCQPHTASVAPLASEYTVASVERLDEPGSGPNETRIAQAQVSQSMTR